MGPNTRPSGLRWIPVGCPYMAPAPMGPYGGRSGPVGAYQVRMGSLWVCVGCVADNEYGLNLRGVISSKDEARVRVIEEVFDELGGPEVQLLLWNQKTS